MVKDLVANSPFINIEFIKSSEKINEPDSKVLFDYYKLDSNTISFQIDRDFSDYRITPYFSDDQIDDLKIKNLEPYFVSTMTLAKKLSLRGIPTTIFIDKEGKEFARVVGSIDFVDKKFLDWLVSFN